MHIIAIGVNHKNTPIEIREQFFLNADQQNLLLSELRNNPSITGACILSTCNRIEIYASGINAELTVDSVLKLVLRIKKFPYSAKLRKYFYRFYDREAIRHLLEVACGLDSMVLGEEQILGQVKAAFEGARELGMLDRIMNILANTAIRTGKMARHDTRINHGGSSVSWAAIVKAEELLGDLKKRSVLLIGAGKMSELAVGHIQNKQFKKLFLMNRTQDNARFLAGKYGGEVVAFCDLKEILSRVDICICSASAPHYILEKNVVERIMPMRGNKPLVFIDISMPRNIDPAIGGIDNVELFQIDDLNEAVDSSMQLRKNAIQKVRRIIEEKITTFETKLKNLPAYDENLPLDYLKNSSSPR